MRNATERCLAALTAFTLGLVLPALAWACSPQSRVVGVTPLAGPPGGSVTMRGEGVPPRTAVEIRWNSPTGQKLGETAAGPDGRFTVAVQVPDVAPDVYYLLAMPADNEAGFGRSAFEVTEPAEERPSSGRQTAAASTSSDLWLGLNRNTGEGFLPSGETPVSGEPVNASLYAGLTLTAVGLGGLGMSVLARGRRRSSKGL